MNAYDLYDAAFDPTISEYWPKDRKGLMQYVSDYAYNGLNVYVNDAVCAIIVDAFQRVGQFKGDSNKSGDLYWLIEKPLSEIVLE